MNRVLIAAALLLMPALVAATPAFEKAFDDPAAWTAAGSDQVDARLRRDGDAVCLDFDFHGVSGFASMRRRLPVDAYPANYAFSFRVRGDTPGNALQFKLIDAGGDNVWWLNQPDFAFTRDWSEQTIKQRRISFAWGPDDDKRLRRSEYVEFVIYAGKGGRGHACFDRLGLRELAPTPATWPSVVASASSAIDGAPAASAVDGDPASAWRSRHGREQALTLDLGTQREFGGLTLVWTDDAPASDYAISLSNDARSWREARRVRDGNGGIDPIALAESDARYIRIAMHAGPANRYGLAGVAIEPLEFGASTNAFFGAIARRAKRGLYPRGILGEQTYWTVVGIDGGHETGLLSEDGALEVGRGGFSIEPFLVDDDGRVTAWADTGITHALRDRYLPMPSVQWRANDVELDVEAFAEGAPGRSRMLAGYRVRNASDGPRTITLALAIQPFQVNPSVQFLNTPGGVSPIHRLALENRDVLVDGRARLRVRDAPDRFVATTFDAGMVAERLGALVQATSNARASADDPTGLASGALLYRLELPARGERRIAVAVPLDGEPGDPAAGIGDETSFSATRDRVAADWHRLLDGVALRLPASAQGLADTLRTALAHILVSRDGPALRPGTRSYARSWIRDGAMMSEALLRLGREDAAQEYFDWYAPYQFRSGKVPCCVDQRGSDPVPENDSHGELVHLAWDIYRYTGDRTRLAAAWPHVDAATRYMDTLRADERAAALEDPARGAFSGLMPASISHEGYSAKPMHSYWDDFWALLGYKDAVSIAAALARDADATRLRAARDRFRTDLYASIASSRAAHAIDYLPGCAELGDFDATSTTIALSPSGEQASLAQDALRATFERYWREFVARRDGTKAWKDYTPYEWRTVGTFVRLGWRQRAHEAIDFFMGARRPSEWNQWAEVVGRDPRESRFVGDMPHGWVASDFMRSVLDLFAYERDGDDALVLAAGVPDAWLAGDGIGITDLRTPYGRLSYTLRRDAQGTHLHIDGDGLQVPPGGFIYAPPVLDAGTPATINGKRTRIANGELRVARVPADILIPNTRGIPSP